MPAGEAGAAGHTPGSGAGETEAEDPAGDTEGQLLSHVKHMSQQVNGNMCHMLRSLRLSPDLPREQEYGHFFIYTI